MKCDEVDSWRAIEAELVTTGMEIDTHTNTVLITTFCLYFQASETSKPVNRTSLTSKYYGNMIANVSLKRPGVFLLLTFKVVVRD